MHLLDGNETVARGAVAAGCRFFAGYPITPATGVLDAMLRLLPPLGGTALQTEDEIAAIGACLGASMAGLKVLTATSGPGLSLYSEHISFAIGSEIPIVIVDVQRLGPSTGSATRGADGDVQFLRWGNSGGLPAIVLAPTGVPDAYTLTVHAFNLAETYRCPVFLASNKEIALTKEGVDLEALPLPTVVSRPAPASRDPFLPFRPDPATGVPPFLPIGSEVPVRQTSSTHGEDGYITTEPGTIQRTVERLRCKLEDDVDRFTFADFREEPGADTLLLTYGVTARAAREAQAELLLLGRPTSLLVLQTLWPVPAAFLRAKTAGFRRILVVEMNLGQYVREIHQLVAGKSVEFLGQMDGRLISPEQIREAALG